MRLVNGHILRRVHGKTVLLPSPEKDIGFNGMITLNHTGEFVCKMLKEETDRESIVFALSQEYGVDADVARKDLDVFLSDLYSCNMIEE